MSFNNSYCGYKNAFGYNSQIHSLNNSFVNQSYFMHQGNPHQIKYNQPMKKQSNQGQNIVDYSFNYYGPYGGGFNMVNNQNHIMTNNLYFLNKNTATDDKQATNYKFNYNLNSNNQFTPQNNPQTQDKEDPKDKEEYKGNNDMNQNVFFFNQMNENQDVNESCFSLKPEKIPYKAITNFPLVKMNEIFLNNGQIPQIKENKFKKYENPAMNKTFCEKDINSLEGEDFDKLFPKKNKYKNKNPKNRNKTKTKLKDGKYDNIRKYNSKESGVGIGNKMNSSGFAQSSNKHLNTSLGAMTSSKNTLPYMGGMGGKNTKSFNPSVHYNSSNQQNNYFNENYNLRYQNNNNSYIASNSDVNSYSGVLNKRTRSLSDYNNEDSKQKKNKNISYAKNSGNIELLDNSYDNQAMTKAYKFPNQKLSKNDNSMIEETDEDH